jgi:hypothetical protein
MRRSRSSPRAPTPRRLPRVGWALGGWLAGWGLACAAAPVAPAPPRCPGDGVVVLASQADVARVAACPTLPGVVVRSGAAVDVSRAGALATITGDLVIGPTVAVEEVTFPGLRVVGGAIRVVGNGLMQGLFLSRLERAGRITIDGNVAMTTVSLPRLQTVHGALHITDNAGLELVDVAALTAIDGDLVVERNPGLVLLEAAQLRRAAAVRIDAPRLPSDAASRLRAVGAAPSPE